MKKEIISHFKENPKTKITWWAMGFGLALLLSPMMLGIFAAAVRPILDSLIGEGISIRLSFVVLFMVLAIAVGAMSTSILSFRKGERSWAMWLGLIPASLGVAFWVFMIVGEFVFPH